MKTRKQWVMVWLVIVLLAGALPAAAQGADEITWVSFEAHHFAGVRPERWIEIESGIFARSMQADAVLIFQWAEYAPEIIIESLEQQGGEFLVDPAEIAPVDVEGRSWIILPALLDGGSYLVGLTEEAGQSVLVALMGAEDELDTLRETVLLPALAGLTVFDAETLAAVALEAGRMPAVAAYDPAPPRFDDAVLTSQYVAMSDGTLIAVDILRPAVDGVAVEEPLPVLWAHTRYQRGMLIGDQRFSATKEMRNPFVYQGYVIAVADVRGSGASFGVRVGEFSAQETQDAYDLTEWFAVQPWCDGSVGMWGVSYLGMTQYMAASTAPPHLKAIFPQMAGFDEYYSVYTNGIFMRDFLEQWDATIYDLDRSQGGSQVAPVDDDPAGEQLAAALALRDQNVYPLALTRSMPFRDNMVNDYGWETLSPGAHAPAVRESGVAVFHLGGWFDMYTVDTFQWYANLEGAPQMLLMPAWNHQGWEDWLPLLELRWFDYWLKGIDTGIMDEDPIWYEVSGASGADRWHSAESWPLPETVMLPAYFAAGPSGSIDSVNDGLIAFEPPTEAAVFDTFTVDYTATLGPANRFSSGYGGAYGYPDLQDNDRKGLTYTTEPLDADYALVGHPVVHLWVSSEAADGDFFVYIEEVDAQGHAEYITEGKIRASHRVLHEPPYDNLGLPWHRSFEADMLPLPAGEPVELVFDMRPTANLFDAGNRLRITITGADADTFETPALDPAPAYTVYRDAAQPSYVELPLLIP